MALDHEKLDVYRVSIEFVRWTGELLERASGERIEMLSKITLKLLGSLRDPVEHEHEHEHGHEHGGTELR